MPIAKGGHRLVIACGGLAFKLPSRSVRGTDDAIAAYASPVAGRLPPTSLIEFAFPLGDCNGRKTVANQIGDRARFVQEAVDAQQK
jgi:hypothetical protein